MKYRLIIIKAARLLSVGNPFAITRNIAAADKGRTRVAYFSSLPPWQNHQATTVNTRLDCVVDIIVERQRIQSGGK